MMDRLREGVNSIAVKIILGLIILSFVFAGVGNYLISGSSNAAAKVGNTEIGRNAFEQAYQNERNRMQSQMGDYFANLLADPAYVQSFRKSVLDRMINDVLIEQYADSLGLRISDEQIRKEILRMEPFQNNGKFDQEIYAASLRRAGFNADSFAEYLRREMTRAQVVTALQASEFVLSKEIENQSKLFTQTRDIRTISLSPEEFAKNLELTEEELQEYYKANPGKYTRPEQAKVAYIELSAQQLKDQIEISDEQAQQYYEENLDKYASAEQRELSHILVQGDDEAKAQAILDELNGGADFAELAKAKSEDIGSAELGGSLGWVEKGVMDADFEAAAFALAKAGDTTGLVKSAFGYHIIKLDNLKASESKPFADVAAEVKAEIVDQQAVEKFYELLTELEKVAFEFPDSLEDAAEAVNQPVQTTDFISQLDAPAVLRGAEVTQALESAEVKEDGLNSEVMEIAPEHVIVVRVEETRDEMVLPFAQVQEKVSQELSGVKGEQKAQEVAKSAVEALKADNEAVLTDNGLEFGEIESIDRSSPLAKVVFAMPKPEADKKGFAQTKDFMGNVVIVELSKVNETIDDSINTQVGAQLVRTGSQQDLEAVLSTLREKADIEYYAVNVQP
ncbi:peptidylprolyl isomerase [Vibrio sp. JC009]|uniref:peptidylprolyl isomerase n=1 Tax=Vibrio sp. JC009 TaxID=2912314 RepID=UPI0023AFC0CD|nr:peptidylprolyl isomerase [Vibrio sp. JC009]WED22594.1 peptidylprolyl isomerase [Vibrio sp. JC009]